jgi:hypothetical protein
MDWTMLILGFVLGWVVGAGMAFFWTMWMLKVPKR